MNDVPDWMIDGSNEIPECQSCIDASKDYQELEKVVDDLVYFINRLVKKLRIDNPDSQLPENALDYLKRHGLNAINLSRKVDAD